MKKDASQLTEESINFMKESYDPKIELSRESLVRVDTAPDLEQVRSIDNEVISFRMQRVDTE